MPSAYLSYTNAVTALVHVAGYADGGLYADGHRRRGVAYADGKHTPTATGAYTPTAKVRRRPRASAASPSFVRRRPRSFAVGVHAGRRRTPSIL